MREDIYNPRYIIQKPEELEEQYWKNLKEALFR